MEISTPSPDGIKDCIYFSPLKAGKPDEIYKSVDFQILEKGSTGLFPLREGKQIRW